MTALLATGILVLFTISITASAHSYRTATTEKQRSMAVGMIVFFSLAFAGLSAVAITVDRTPFPVNSGPVTTISV